MIELSPYTRRIYALMAVLICVATAVGGTTLFLLYRTALAQQRRRLVDLARSSARLIDSIHRHEVEAHGQQSLDAVLNQLSDLASRHRDIGTTGEFTLARREGEQMVFVQRQRHAETGIPHPIRIDSELAEPMRRALAGLSGSMIGIDYRGETVVAGYEPVAAMDLGVVAKIDLWEVRAPFLRAGALAGGTGLALLLAGVFVSLRIGGAVITRIQESQKLLKHIASGAPLLIAYVDSQQRYRFVNQEYERWFGLPPDSIIGRTVAEVVGEQGYQLVRDSIRRALAGETVSYEELLPLPGGRTRHCHARYIPHINPAGAIEGYIVLAEDITDRKAAEEALRISEETHRLAMEATLDGLWDWNLKTGQVFYSAAWANVLGEAAVRGEYSSWESRLHPDDRPRVVHSLQEHLDSKTQRWEMEHRLRAKDGTWRWVLGRGRVVTRDTDGTPLRMLGTMTDISKRKQAEEALRDSEARFRSLTSLGPAGIFLTDASGECVYVNQRWQEMAGLTAEQARGKGWIEGLHPDDRESIGTDWYRSVESEERWGHEYRFRNRQGKVTWVYSTARPIQDPDGLVQGWVGVNTDITPRRQVEAELRRERDFSRSLIDTAQVIILVLDPSGRIVSFNPYMEQVSGYRMDEVAGEDWFETLLPEEDRDGIRNVFFSVVSHGRIRGNINPIITKDGRPRDIEWFAKALRDESGEAIGVLAVGQDVTERVALEERLRHAEKMDAIGQLAGGIAHDFNNQLGAILGYAELLADNLEDPRHKNYAEAIAQAAARSGELTHELLTFARKVPQKREPVDLHKTIGEVAMLLGRTIDRRITIRKTLGAANPVVLGDPAQIEAALLNLGLNSRDAMPQGGEIQFSTDLITIEQSTELAPGEYLAVSVTDTGVGMDERIRARVFEPFFTTKGSGGGTGMGLAMVYGTAKSHGGKVELSSQVGKGTVITLCLPLATGSSTSAKEQHEHCQPLPNAHILVVEDEAGMREMLTNALKNLGLEVTAHHDGLAALEHFKHQSEDIDAVILDLDMPRLDGVQTLLEMRKIDPVVKAMLSSGHAAGRRLDTLLNERTSFLPKPYHIEELRKHLEHLLDRH